MSVKDDLLKEIQEKIPTGIEGGVTALNLRTTLSDMTIKMIDYTDATAGDIAKQLKSYEEAVAMWSSANITTDGLLIVEDPSLGWKMTNVYETLKALDVLSADLTDVYAKRLRTGREYRVNLIQKEGGDHLYNVFIGEAGDPSLAGAGGAHDQFELYKKLV